LSIFLDYFGYFEVEDSLLFSLFYPKIMVVSLSIRCKTHLSIINIRSIANQKQIAMNSYIYENQNSKSFYNMAWIAFIISFIGMGAGIWYLDGDIAIKGFLLMSYLFSVTACFTVAKVVRDKHESENFLNKIEKSKTEKFLADNV